MNTEKEMTIDQAMVKLKKYQHCLDVALNIGHGTAESAEVNEALIVVIETYNEITKFMARAIQYF